MALPVDKLRVHARTILLTTAAMLAFAANSILCRMALGQGLIDPASFTSIRIIAGAVTLGLLVALTKRKTTLPRQWSAIAALFGYMVFFSFAYISLNAGTGALLLFGSVQLTMFVAAIRSGERFSALSWIGLAAAFGGLVYLVAPGVTAPEPVGALLMVLSGIAWGVYSLVGRSSSSPLPSTAANFVYCIPLTIALSALFVQSASVSLPGTVLAIASGSIASGIGYAIWYSVLPQLTTGRAATVQLSVPIIAAVGGVLLLSEPATVRLVVASGLTLGGIWLVLTQRLR